MVVGRLQQRAWTAEDGSIRSVVEVVADELGPSLRHLSLLILGVILGLSLTMFGWGGWPMGSAGGARYWQTVETWDNRVKDFCEHVWTIDRNEATRIWRDYERTVMNPRIAEWNEAIGNRPRVTGRESRTFTNEAAVYPRLIAEVQRNFNNFVSRTRFAHSRIGCNCGGP